MYNKILKRLRFENNLTQVQVANTLGMNRTTYTYYELGKTKPNLEVLMKMARMYNITVDALIGFAPYEENSSKLHVAQERGGYIKGYSSNISFPDIAKEEQELVLSYRVLTDDSKSKLLECLKELKSK